VVRSAPKKRANARPRAHVAKDAVTLRQEIEDLIKREAVPMVKSTIGEAEDGHFAAMKYLFEMVGLFPGTVEPESEQDDSLAKILLQRLGMTDVTPGTSDSAKGISTIGDAVE
jgi:hypothetical protein